MGTDIHLFTERRASKDAPWELFAVETKCTWCDGSGKAPEHVQREGCYNCDGAGKQKGCGDRNYSLFAMLANVRNGRGFAGVDIGSGFNPIAKPRGLPEDMSTLLRKLQEDKEEGLYESFSSLYGEGWLGDHSFSHLSLRELLNYDWQQVTEHRGQCGLKTYAEWKKKGSNYPDYWCGDCTGPRVYHVSERVADALIAGIVVEPFACALTDFMRTAVELEGGLPLVELEAWAKGTPGVSIYAPVRVRDTYAESAGHFYSAFLPALVAAGDPDNVRIVFGFDS